MFFIFYILWLWFLISVVAAMVVSWRFIRRQKEINELIADYVAADLLKTWETSAEKLVEKIREPGN